MLGWGVCRGCPKLDDLLEGIICYDKDNQPQGRMSRIMFSLQCFAGGFSRKTSEPI